MTILQVPDMHCEHCVSRITAALSRLGLSFEVKLDEHQVHIAGDAAAIEQAVEALDDLGFDVTGRS